RARRGRADPAAADADLPRPERGGARRVPRHGPGKGEDRADCSVRARRAARRPRPADGWRAHLAHRSSGSRAPPGEPGTLAMPPLTDEPFTLVRSEEHTSELQ